MNKKIVTELGVGIILILAITFSLLILAGNKKISQQVASLPIQENNATSQADTTGRKTYQNGKYVLELSNPAIQEINDNYPVNASPAVKKSANEICHPRGTILYENTKNFTPYDSMDECLKSPGYLSVDDLVVPPNCNSWKVCQYEGLEHEIPCYWVADIGYMSPAEIEYFGKYGRGPNNAAISKFDLVEDGDPSFKEVNYMTRLYSEYISKIENSQRKNADEEVIIEGKIFTKYDLINFKEYDGKDYGNVIIFVSPPFNYDGGKRYFALEWHEYPGGQELIGNNKNVFLNVISSIRFTGKKCPELTP